jgi:hypothetical protein
MPRYVEAENHLRALNGMMAAFGMISPWTCSDLPRVRSLVGLLRQPPVTSRLRPQ